MAKLILCLDFFGTIFNTIETFVISRKKQCIIACVVFVIGVIKLAVSFYDGQNKEVKQVETEQTDAKQEIGVITINDEDTVEGKGENSSDEHIDEETVNEGRSTDNKSMPIPPIVKNPKSIDDIVNARETAQALTINYFSGSVSFDGQEIEYNYNPSESGTYRFEYADVADGVDFNLWICNSDGETIKSDYNLDNGHGITITLESGTTYIIRVGQCNGFGSYKLIIGEQKSTFDISNLTEVSDSIQYTDQENNYMMSVSVSGVYRFEFSDVPEGTDLNLYIFNYGWEEIKSAYDLDSGDGITVELEMGKSYYIRAEQYRNVGNYTLKIGKQKEIVDVSEYTVIEDSVQHTEQKNSYRFTAKLFGIYRFELADVHEGTDLNLSIFNSGWEEIKSAYDLDNGDGISLNLQEGQEIFISVTQYKSLGSYSLIIGQPKKIENISNVGEVIDSIEYTDQRNAYLYEAMTDGFYSFTLYDVPDAVYYKMEIYNSGWELIKSDYEMNSGDGMSVELSKGQKIYVCVEQYKGFQEYCLVVSKG